LTGIGMNTFRVLGPARHAQLLGPPTGDTVHAHDNLLQAALDVGIPGLVAYTAIWLLAGALLIDTYRHAHDQIYRTIAGGLGAGLIAHFVFGMTDAIPLGAKAGILFWLALALAVGLHRIARSVSPQPHGDG
jgi:putative inorganic carbon (HCO3(-)) transporter